MNQNIEFCLTLHLSHANLTRKLDDELGIHHGSSFKDFALLSLLAKADDGRLSIQELAQSLGQLQSSLMRQLIVLEKIGIIARGGMNGCRQAVLRPAGRALVNAARETTNSICTETFASITPATLENISETLRTLTHGRT